MLRKERELKRAIDDAYARVRHYRVTMGLIIAAFLALVGMGAWGLALGAASVGTGIDMGGIAAGSVFAGLVGGCGSFFTGWWWWELHNMENHEYAGPPSRHVTAALRAAEDHTDAVVSGEISA